MGGRGVPGAPGGAPQDVFLQKLGMDQVGLKQQNLVR